MAHQYDTGLAVPQRTAIRNAIVARLARLKKTANPPLYVAANGIKTLPRPLRGEGDIEGLTMLGDLLRGQAPAIAIALGRLQYVGRGLAATEGGGELDIAVYVVSGHARGATEGRLYGDAIAAAANTADPGIFTILEHVRQLLLGQELGIAGVGELRATEEDEVVTDGNETVWEQRYTVDLEIEIKPWRYVAQKLTEIEAHHELDGIPDGHAHDPLITTITTTPDP